MSESPYEGLNERTDWQQFAIDTSTYMDGRMSREEYLKLHGGTVGEVINTALRVTAEQVKDHDPDVRAVITFKDDGQVYVWLRKGMSKELAIDLLRAFADEMEAGTARRVE